MKRYFLYIGGMNGYGRKIEIDADCVKVRDGAYCFYSGYNNMFDEGEFVAAYPVMFTEITKVEKIEKI